VTGEQRVSSQRPATGRQLSSVARIQPAGAMGASGSVHDVLAEDPVFERVREGGDGDVEGRAGRRDDVLELPIGLPPIRVAFRDERTIFCACEHGAVCLIQLPRLPASSASSPCIFEAASSGPPVVKTPIGNLVSSLGAISGTSVDLLSMVRAFPSLRRLGGRTEMTAWLWDYCQGASALAPDGSRVSSQPAWLRQVPSPARKA